VYRTQILEKLRLTLCFYFADDVEGNIIRPVKLLDERF